MEEQKKEDGQEIENTEEISKEEAQGSSEAESAAEEDLASDTESETLGEDADAEATETEAEDTDPADTKEEGEEAKQDGTEKKGFFKKNKKKDKKDEKIEELNDRLLRNMAEFENFRNRSEKEKTLMFEIGAKSVVEKILPVVDNFERGLDAVSDEEKENAFVKGMEAVYKQFSTVLEEIGVVPIEAVGREFDPNLHNAVMHDEDDSMEANMISEEFQKGYMYKDSVVRHSMVKVVN